MKDGGPAFPAVPNPDFYRGLSLRDWFAGMALRELRMSDPAYDWKKLAARAYDYADAMIAEREKSTAPD